MFSSPLLSLTVLIGGVQLATATGYTLDTSYDSTNFFDGWDFETFADPTGGFVTYQDQSTAQSQGLAKYQNGQVYLGVDNTTTLSSSSGAGRSSLRLQTQKTWTKMLVVADIAHMPVGCGTWPALWSWGQEDSSLGNGWPYNGEIDIIEGVNDQNTNEMTLHTQTGCTMSPGTQASDVTFTEGEDCSAGAEMGDQGCPQKGTQTNNYGTGFNDNEGGYYAMEWTSSEINIWHFTRSDGSSIFGSSSSSIDTSSFGTPLAQFVGGSGCDIDSHFNAHMLTIDTTFCGQWAGDQWSSYPSCAAKATTCADYVAANPSAFDDAYWLFNSVKVYTTSGSGSGSGSSSTATASRDTANPTTLVSKRKPYSQRESVGKFVREFNG